MDATAKLVERYLDTWNETDPHARRVRGRERLGRGAPGTSIRSRTSKATTRSRALIGAVQEQVPGHVFRLLDNGVDAHHNVARFSWELVPATGGESLAIGFDVAVTDENGRIAKRARLPRQGARSLSAIRR